MSARKSSRALQASTKAGPAPNGEFRMIPIALLVDHPENPRLSMDDESLRELADSIRAKGVVEPLIVRPRPDETFEVIAGHRRKAASLLADAHDAPCIIREYDDDTALEVMLIENLQRRDLNCVEEAEAMAKLHARGKGKTEIADQIGKNRRYVDDRLALLEMPGDVIDLVRHGKLPPSHVEALRKYSRFPELVSDIAKLAVKNKATVRDLTGSGVPYSYQLPGRVRRLEEYGVGFDWTQHCDPCPYNARIEAEQYGSRVLYCLNPTHFEELKATALAEREAQREIALVQIQETREKAAAGEAVETPRLRDLSGVLGTSVIALNPDRLPPGCSEACACRSKALDEDGAEVALCLQPERARELWQEFQAQRDQQARAEIARHAERVFAAISAEGYDADGGDGDGQVLVVSSRPLAAALWRQVAGPRWYRQVETQWLTRFGLPQLDEVAEKLSWDDVRGSLDALAALPPSFLLLALVGTILGHEGHLHHDDDGACAWLLGELDAPETETVPDDPFPQEYEETPTAAGCHVCGYNGADVDTETNPLRTCGIAPDGRALVICLNCDAAQKTAKPTESEVSRD